MSYTHGAARPRSFLSCGKWQSHFASEACSLAASLSYDVELIQRGEMFLTERVLKFLSKMPKEENDVNVDAALIYSTENRFYMSGFKSSDGLIMITRQNAYFLVDFRYYESAYKSVDSFEIILTNNFKNTIADIIKKENLRGILLESEKMTLALAKRFEIIFDVCGAKAVKSSTLDDILFSMRMFKDKTEIENIKVAQEIAEAAFSYALPRIKIGIKEKDIALDLEFFMRKNGASKSAFDIIVVSGKNSSLPHGEPGSKPIEKGDFITIDMGAVYNGYSSDMTRTIAVGAVNDRQKEIYNTVLKAQTSALAQLKPGAKCSDIDKVARDIIYNAGFKGCFGHSLGHGVGIKVHEKPNLSPNSKDVLEAGMVVTIEPGIYIENEFGVRIEDMVLIDDSGYKNFTNVKKDLIII